MISAILAALANIIIQVVVALIVVTFERLADWFFKRAAAAVRLPNKHAVTVAESIASGDVAIVQGIFDSSNNSFTTARRVTGSDTDGQMRAVHRQHRVAIWQ
jgi:hypothetical protein